MRSKPESGTSPTTGGATGGANDGAAAPVTDLPADAPAPAAEPAGSGKKPADKSRANVNRTEIDLEVSRGRSTSWTIFGLIFGALLIWKLGTVGVWGGIVLVAMGTYHAWLLIQTFLYPAGTIIVSDGEVSLPRGLCMPRPVQAKPQDVTAVYFLRRSVPWNHASPVLVVELGPKAMAFPRDWFASEADQRHVIHALMRDQSGASASNAASAGNDKPA
jgi:hypothetical protein